MQKKAYELISPIPVERRTFIDKLLLRIHSADKDYLTDEMNVAIQDASGVFFRLQFIPNERRPGKTTINQLKELYSGYKRIRSDFQNDIINAEMVLELETISSSVRNITEACYG